MMMETTTRQRMVTMITTTRHLMMMNTTIGQEQMITMITTMITMITTIRQQMMMMDITLQEITTTTTTTHGVDTLIILHIRPSITSVITNPSLIGRIIHRYCHQEYHHLTTITPITHHVHTSNTLHVHTSNILPILQHLKISILLCINMGNFLFITPTVLHMGPRNHIGQPIITSTLSDFTESTISALIVLVGSPLPELYFT
mmetsp:Transcript_21526/g.31624  ORF Transcript_21526/g.31624 Transcript_21526/m.31624 type:complete len:202 (-) Transcript_21526:470-1075(-)